MDTKIIDGHMHISQWMRADGKTVFDAIRDYQAENNISYVDNMCCSNNADLWDGFEADQSILGAIAKLENPTVFTHGCLYIPKNKAEDEKFNFKTQLEELMELGLDGVKLCELKPDSYKLFDIDSRLEKMAEYVDHCEKYNVHMCWHVADPKEFWDPDKVSDEVKKRGWFYGDGSYPSYEKLISLAYEMLDKHPKLRVLLAHAFFKSFEPDETAALLEKYPNVNIDFAPGWEMFDGFRTHYERWREIFGKYSDRFVYATDATASAFPTGYIYEIPRHILRFLQTDEEFAVPSNHAARGIKLEKAHLDNILYKNHEKMLGKSPKPINKRALKKYIERYLPLMPDTKNKQMTEEYYRKNLL